MKLKISYPELGFIIGHTLFMDLVGNPNVICIVPINIAISTIPHCSGHILGASWRWKPQDIADHVVPLISRDPEAVKFLRHVAAGGLHRLIPFLYLCTTQTKLWWNVFECIGTIDVLFR